MHYERANQRGENDDDVGTIQDWRKTDLAGGNLFALNMKLNFKESGG